MSGTNTNADILLFYDALKIMPERIAKSGETTGLILIL